MSEVPSDMRYTKSHEWVKQDDDAVLVGITEHAQEQLGDMVFVELPEVGSHFDAADACAVVESVKAASDLYAPVSGEVLEVNELLVDSPETVNSDSYGDGWIMKLKPDDPNSIDELLDSGGYQEYLAAEEE